MCKFTINIKIETLKVSFFFCLEVHTLHSSCFHVSLCICIVHRVHVSSCNLPLGVLFLGLGRSYTLQNVHYSTMSLLYQF